LQSIGAQAVFVVVAIALANVRRVMGPVLLVPDEIGRRLGVVEDPVAVSGISPSAQRLGAGALPDDLVAEPVVPEDAVAELLEIVRGMGIAVQVQAASGLQYPPDLYQAQRHERQIRPHRVACRQARADDGVVQGRIGRLLQLCPLLLGAVHRPRVVELRPCGV